MRAVDAESKEGNGQNVETQPVKSSKSQGPSSREAQSSNYKQLVRVVPLAFSWLVFEYSLVIGFWSLELPPERHMGRGLLEVLA